MGNIDYVEVGQRIKQRRKDIKLSQEALAKILGLNKRTIINWEKGKLGNKIDFDKFLELCAVLEMDIPFLLGNDYATKELETVCKYTGLSENTAKMLHSFSHYEYEHNTSKFLSNLFDKYEGKFAHFLDFLEEYLVSSLLEKKYADHIRKKCSGLIIVQTQNKHSEHAAFKLFQCQIALTELKADMEKDDYIVSGALKDKVLLDDIRNSLLDDLPGSTTGTNDTK